MSSRERAAFVWQSLSSFCERATWRDESEVPCRFATWTGRANLLLLVVMGVLSKEVESLLSPEYNLLPFRLSGQGEHIREPRNAMKGKRYQTQSSWPARKQKKVHIGLREAGQETCETERMQKRLRELELYLVSIDPFSFLVSWSSFSLRCLVLRDTFCYDC